MHATDVLHGVYYFTTQPIPGLQQVNIDSDLFRRPASSSESGTAARHCPLVISGKTINVHLYCNTDNLGIYHYIMLGKQMIASVIYKK